MKRWIPPVVLSALFVLFRVPALINAGFINSDGAIAGLQARRMLEGEWEWLHWARDYLTSIDSVVAAPFFAVFGATPLVLMLVTLLGQLTCAWLAYAIVARRIGDWPAFVVSLPLVFMTMASNIYLFFDVRQWCLALAMLAFWLIDRAADSAWPRVALVVGVVLGFVAMFVDLFAVQLLPGVILFAVLSATDGTWKLKARLPALVSVIGALGLGVVALKALRTIAHVGTGRAEITTGLIARNWPLLTEQCLPWLIGAKVYALTATGSIAQQPSPTWFVPVQVLGAIIFVLALLSGAVLFFVQRIPWGVRALGAAGAGVAFTCIVGFLTSGTAEDIMGGRLLLPVVLTVPFTLAPLAYLAGRWLALVLSPYLLTAAIGGWLSYGLFVDGLVPVRTERGLMSEDFAIGEFLRSRGIRYAAADYWIAYRLTFILEEDPIVVPEASEERYPRWREEFDAASKVAYLVHPSSPGLTTEMIEKKLVGKTFEKVSVRGFTVFIVTDLSRTRP